MSNEQTVGLPEELNQEFQGMALANESLVLSQRYEEAWKGFRQIYDMIQRAQPPDFRYHNGYALHQMGMTYVLSGKPGKALRYFILAYIEDLLSAAEDKEDDADEMPAAKNLRQVYRVTEDALNELTEIVRQKKRARRTIHDPNEIFKELAAGRLPLEVVEPSQEPDISAMKKEPGRFECDWENRVFVGGSYGTHWAEIEAIKTVCKNLDYEPVVSGEFRIPGGDVHHQSLMLLHECSKAVFEVTEPAGQLMEIERLRDYQVRPLIVCQVNANLSEMLEALLKSQGYEVKRYRDIPELEDLVKEFLL